MANSVNPDQTAPKGAVLSKSTLFAYVILSELLVDRILGQLSYFEPALVAQLDAHPTGDQEVAGSVLSWLTTFFRGD